MADEQTQAVARREPSIMEIISAVAANPEVDVAKMRELLALKLDVERRDAEIAFNQAMARVQPRLPRVKKNGRISYPGKDGHAGMNTPYARWEDIDTAIRPLLTEEGLSLSFTAQPSPSGVLMTCTISHIQGHSKSSQMQLPPDAGSGRNALQAIGSSHSYGKRYLTLDMLNIITEGEDSDGGKAYPLTADQLNNVRSMVDACELKGQPLKAFLTFAGAATVEMIQQLRYEDVMQALRKKQKQMQGGA